MDLGFLDSKRIVMFQTSTQILILGREARDDKASRMSSSYSLLPLGNSTIKLSMFHEFRMGTGTIEP